MDEPTVYETIKKISPKYGDIILITLSGEFHHEKVEYFSKQLNYAYPDVNFIFVKDISDIKALSAEDLREIGLSRLQ